MTSVVTATLPSVVNPKIGLGGLPVVEEPPDEFTPLPGDFEPEEDERLKADPAPPPTLPPVTDLPEDVLHPPKRCAKNPCHCNEEEILDAQFIRKGGKARAWKTISKAVREAKERELTEKCQQFADSLCRVGRNSELKCECWPHPVCLVSERTATSADMENKIVKRAARRGEGVLVVQVLKCSATGSWCTDA